MFKELYERYSRYSSRLPSLERVGFHYGVIGFVIGATQTEVGNPIIGGIEVILGALLIGASFNAEDSTSVLDNRGTDLV